MKTKIFIALFLGMIFSFMATACEEEKVDNFQLEVKNINYKPAEVDSTGTCTDEPCLKLLAINSKYLQITHKNTMFCCGTEVVDVNLELANDTILINEIDRGPFTYSFCHYDLSYEIGPLEYKSYTLKVIGCETSYDRDTIYLKFDYSEDLIVTNCEGGSND